MIVETGNAFSVEEAREARREGQKLRDHLSGAPTIRRAFVDEWADAAIRLRRRIAQDQRDLAHYLHAIEGIEPTQED